MKKKITIDKPIILELKSYNLIDAEKELFRKIINDHPNCANISYAKNLGISDRTFYRLCTKWDIKMPQTFEFEQKAIKYLEDNGYKVSKEGGE